MAEAQTLTYDSTEQAEGELSKEEQESLEVGEKLAEQQNELLAGKFKDAEDLEKGYLELQKKLGESSNEDDAPKDEVEEPEEEEDSDGTFLDTLWDESINNKWTDDTLDKLGNMEAKDIAQMHLDYRSKNPTSEGLSEEHISELKAIPGGEEKYTGMMQWANTALTETEQKMYDAVMEKGDPLAAFFAVQSLTYRYNDAQGVEGELLTGKAAVEKGDAFRSQAEVVRAMSDPKYDNDPAYRQDIYNKLERSKNIKF